MAGTAETDASTLGLQRIARVLAEHGPALVLTGAGMSTHYTHLLTH